MKRFIFGAASAVLSLGQSQQDMQKMLNWAINQSDPLEIKRVSDEYEASGKTIKDIYGEEVISQIFETQPDIITKIKVTLNDELERWEKYISGEITNESVEKENDVRRAEFQERKQIREEKRAKAAAFKEKFKDEVEGLAEAKDAASEEDEEIEQDVLIPLHQETVTNVLRLIAVLGDELGDLNVAQDAEKLGITPLLVKLVKRGTFLDDFKWDKSTEGNKNTQSNLNDVSEQAAWALGSMLSNNFPVQAEFNEKYPEFQQLHTILVDAINSRDWQKFSLRKRLFYGITTLMLGGDPRVIENCSPLLSATYAALKTDDWTNLPLTKEENGISNALQPQHYMWQKFMSFLRGINELEIFTLKSLDEYKKKRKEEYQNWPMASIIGNEVPKLTYLDSITEDHVSQYIVIDGSLPDSLVSYAKRLYRTFQPKLPDVFTMKLEPEAQADDEL